MCVQYSAASFIETINTNSLSMDADEFIARMVTAGVPDMQLMPQLATQRSAAAPAAPPAVAALLDPNSGPSDERAGATPSALSEAESGPTGAAALPDVAAERPAAPALAEDAAAGAASSGAAAAGGGLPLALHPPLPALPLPQVCAGACGFEDSLFCGLKPSAM